MFHPGLLDSNIFLRGYVTEENRLPDETPKYQKKIKYLEDLNKNLNSYLDDATKLLETRTNELMASRNAIDSLNLADRKKVAEHVEKLQSLETDLQEQKLMVRNAIVNNHALQDTINKKDLELQKLNETLEKAQTLGFRTLGISESVLQGVKNVQNAISAARNRIISVRGTIVSNVKLNNMDTNTDNEEIRNLYMMINELFDAIEEVVKWNPSKTIIEFRNQMAELTQAFARANETHDTILENCRNAVADANRKNEILKKNVEELRVQKDDIDERLKDCLESKQQFEDRVNTLENQLQGRDRAPQSSGSPSPIRGLSLSGLADSPILEQPSLEDQSLAEVASVWGTSPPAQDTSFSSVRSGIVEARRNFRTPLPERQFGPRTPSRPSGLFTGTGTRSSAYDTFQDTDSPRRGRIRPPNSRRSATSSEASQLRLQSSAEQIFGTPLRQPGYVHEAQTPIHGISEGSNTGTILRQYRTPPSQSEHQGFGEKLFGDQNISTQESFHSYPGTAEEEKKTAPAPSSRQTEEEKEEKRKEDSATVRQATTEQRRSVRERHPPDWLLGRGGPGGRGRGGRG